MTKSCAMSVTNYYHLYETFRLFVTRAEAESHDVLESNFL